MNEKRIQQVLEIEKQARAAYEEAIKKAKEMPAQAEQDALLIVEKARTEAEAQAKQMLEKAQSGEESARILSQTEENIRHAETVANRNFDRAVSFVLSRVAGKE